MGYIPTFHEKITYFFRPAWFEGMAKAKGTDTQSSDSKINKTAFIQKAVLWPNALLAKTYAQTRV